MNEIPIIYVISDDHYHYLRHYLRHFRRSLSMSFLSSPLPYGRAPKGDGGLISRACLRILISRAPCRVLWLPFQKVSRADGGLNSLKERLTRPHLRSQSSGPLLKSGRLTPGSQVGVRARFPFAGG